MKKHFIFTLPGFLFLVIMSSCFHNHNNISISISDDDDEYEMEASYRRDQVHEIRTYLNEHLLKNSSVSFKSRSMDEEITLEDNTRFYINAHPGELRIKIDKTENSEESCEKVKEACEDIKNLLAEN